MSQSPSTIKATAIDWAPPNYPVIATTTGSIMIFDLGLNTANSSVLTHSLAEPMKSPAFLPSNIGQYLRSCMENNEWGELQNKLSQEDASVNPRDILRNCFGEIMDDV